MKLPSHLAKSRHGVFYFRLTFRDGGGTKEKRISLRTKNPQEARCKATCLSAIMATRQQHYQAAMSHDSILAAERIAEHSPDNDFLLNLLHKVDRQQLAELAGLSPSQIDELFATPAPAPDVRKLDIEIPGGFVLRNVNSDDDMHRAVHILQTLNLSVEAMAKLIAGPKPEPLAPTAASAPKPQEGGTTIQEMVPRFANRKKNKLSAKALYEYGNYHQKFVEWLETRKKSKHIPVHAITRADVADFIDDLLSDGIGERTVSNKYLPALNGLFELAQTMGLLPEGQQLVSRGHKVFTKSDFKKASATLGYKPFTDDELKTIFKSELLKDTDRPADFWLPMLGLFTGGRISELAQLDIADIQQHGDIWAISINDEGDKSVKALASRRLIPLHPTLVDCGFLDYLKDAAQHGTKLFPYLTPDRFGSYGGTPSERWGKYLDGISIKDPQKVFHSFRSTSNDRLKQNGVPEETRCQFIGHEHDTVNSSTYSEPHGLPYLLENVAAKLTYPGIDFTCLKYGPGQFSDMLAKLCAKKARAEAHKAAKAKSKSSP